MAHPIELDFQDDAIRAIAAHTILHPQKFGVFAAVSHDLHTFIMDQPFYLTGDKPDETFTVDCDGVMLDVEPDPFTADDVSANSFVVTAHRSAS